MPLIARKLHQGTYRKHEVIYLDPLHVVALIPVCTYSVYLRYLFTLGEKLNFLIVKYSLNKYGDISAVVKTKVI